eukprot:gb/GFBE01007949.1/.p1 GENE.gb/GFBE01007949.1/~~gb/GFBE01007949.1/.p1  ORF type:complete len:355 (+),score=39.32 gb/GFBE01007949.1/:1-1065(+)
MPRLILEVLSLQLHLPRCPEDTGEKDVESVCDKVSDVAHAAASIDLWCELAPSWDPASAAAFSATSAETVRGTCLEWCSVGDGNIARAELTPNSGNFGQAKPLVAYSVLVPPVGGLAHLAAQDLQLRLLLPAGKGSWAPVSATGPLKFPLQPLQRAASGSAVSLRSKQLASTQCGVSAVVWAAWRAAPPGLKQLLDLPLLPKPPPQLDVELDSSNWHGLATGLEFKDAAKPVKPRVDGSRQQRPNLSPRRPNTHRASTAGQRRAPARVNSSTPRQRPVDWRAEQLLTTTSGASSLLLRRLADTSSDVAAASSSMVQSAERSSRSSGDLYQAEGGVPTRLRLSDETKSRFVVPFQ